VSSGTLNTTIVPLDTLGYFGNDFMGHMTQPTADEGAADKTLFRILSHTLWYLEMVYK